MALTSEFAGESRQSSARWLLLSKFLTPNSDTDFAQADFWRASWEDALGMSLGRAVESLIHDGLLGPPTKQGLLRRMTVVELRARLKELNLSSQGHKEDLVQRLMTAKLDYLEEAARTSKLLECTDRGRALAQEYLNRQKDIRFRAEHVVLDTLAKGEFAEAARLMGSFEAQQVFPRGMGIDWKNYQFDRDIRDLKRIFTAQPKILKGISAHHLSVLRLLAGMMLLWGTGRNENWIPLEFETGLPFDNETAARMLLFYGRSHTALDEYRSSNVVEAVQVLAASDSCPRCQALAAKKTKYHLDKAPELPYEKCTSEKGCRCVFVAVVKGLPPPL
jgi:hypothetical protein